MRRALELILSLVGLAAAAMPLAAIAVAIRILDGSPVLFRQRRVGRGFRPFILYKFRTMVIAPGAECRLAVGADPRITPLGRRLRRHHLDELPQLVNILLGQMSFIGPRPELPRFVDPRDPLQQQVLAVRPGLFDAASLHWLDEARVLGQADDWENCYRKVVLPDKLARSLEGIRSRSAGNDLRLLWTAVKHVLDKAGPDVP